MELFFIVSLGIVASLLWFFAVMRAAKYTVGKDAKIWQILSFLTLAGPVGWIVILIIIITDIIESSFPNLHK